TLIMSCMTKPSQGLHLTQAGLLRTMSAASFLVILLIYGLPWCSKFDSALLGDTKALGLCIYPKASFCINGVPRIDFEHGRASCALEFNSVYLDYQRHPCSADLTAP